MTKILPEADFPLHEDSWKVKKMTKELAHNFDHGYIRQ